MRQRCTCRAARAAVDPRGVHADEEPTVKASVTAADGAVAPFWIESFVGEHEVDYAIRKTALLAGIGRGGNAAHRRSRLLSEGVLHVNLLAQGRLDSIPGKRPPYPGTS